MLTRKLNAKPFVPMLAKKNNNNNFQNKGMLTPTKNLQKKTPITGQQDLTFDLSFTLFCDIKTRGQ